MPRKILLADDSVTAQNMGRKILSDAGYEVVTVNNGSAALKKIAEQKPDLVILDVYMPGYGGLEVCQRIKEERETLAIPVLLTVGKLEPFKPEEARRVRADGHLVKPFEASELLGALTKLEDRIVPKAQDGIMRRSTPGNASASAADFGDSDSGWKNRLVIPAAKAKNEAEKAVEVAEAPATSEAPARSTSFRTFEHPPEPINPVDTPGTAASIYKGGMPDITADEIAAIAAAAEAFGTKTARPEPNSFAHAAPAQETQTALPTADAANSGQPETAGQAGALIAEPSVAATSGAAEEHCAEPSVAEAEVAAVLESLAPGGSAGGRAPLPEEVPIAVGSAASGPRWIAEEVALAEGEASFILETEMQKVFAALAGAKADAEGSGSEPPAESVSRLPEDAGRAMPEQISVSVEDTASHSSTGSLEKPKSGSAEPEEAPAEAAASAVPASEAVAEAVAAGPVSEPVNEVSVHHAEPAAEIAATTSSQESEPVSAEVAAVEGTSLAEPTASAPEAQAEASETPVAEAVRAETSAPDIPAISSETTPQSEFQAAEIQPTAAEAEPVAALAAAAAVGAGFRSISANGSTEAIASTAAEPHTSESAGTDAAEPPVEAAHNAELAAAWAQWRQIRETMGSKLSSHDEAAAVEALAESHAAAAPESASAPAEPGSSEPGAIASIVDSMLAELRPKLVEEIAKKMGKERK